VEVDDEYPSLTAGLTAAHDAAIISRDFTAACRTVAAVHVAFARGAEVGRCRLTLSNPY
jgi:hypothetical protein